MTTTESLPRTTTESLPRTTTESLPRTTTERLRKVADIIETNPKAWCQGDWFRISPSEVYQLVDQFDWHKDHWGDLLDQGGNYVDLCSVNLHQGRDAADCGTRCCIAGWAIRYTPKDIVLSTNVESAGGEALGLDYNLASLMFSGGFGQGFTEEEAPGVVAHLLRRLADLPEGARTKEAVRWLIDNGDEIIDNLMGHLV